MVVLKIIAIDLLVIRHCLVNCILPQNQAIMEGQGESSMVQIFHHIVACEALYVYNNIVIYLERRETVPEELLHSAYMYPSCNQIS